LPSRAQQRDKIIKAAKAAGQIKEGNPKKRQTVPDENSSTFTLAEPRNRTKTLDARATR
jgi:hypothetical protein